MDVRIAAVAPEFEVAAERQPWRASPAQQRSIDRLWSAQLERAGGRLRDGLVLTHVASDRRKLLARPMRWSDVHAGRVDPGLFEGRPPEPLSVQGVVTTHGHVVLGLRRADAANWPGRWELTPACALDGAFLDPRSGRVDAVAQLLAELVDATPLPRPSRAAVQPLALCFEEVQRAWSLALSVDLELGPEAVEEIEAASSATYDTFRVARPVDVIEAGLWGGEELVPLSWALTRLPSPRARAA